MDHRPLACPPIRSGVLAASRALLLITAALAPANASPPDGARPRVFWQEFFDCTLPGLPDGWSPRVAKDQKGMRITCPEMFAVEDDPTAPGAKALRISAPMPLQKNAHIEGKCGHAILSFHLRGSRDGLKVQVAVKHQPKAFVATRSWKRHRMAIAAPQPGGDWGRGTVTVQLCGPDTGSTWVAGLQLEEAGRVKRLAAKGWSQRFDLHYGHDERIAHGGTHSLRAPARSGPDRPVPGAEQTAALQKASGEPIVVAAWCRTEGMAASGDSSGAPKIGIVAYGPHRKPDVAAMEKKLSGVRLARAIGRAERALNRPVATGALVFADAPREWTRREISLKPRAPVERIVVTPSYAGATGTAWFDDISVTCGNQDVIVNGGFEVSETQWVPSPDAELSPFSAVRHIKSDNWPDPPEVNCAVVDRPPVIDGRLDDRAWGAATAIGTLVDFATGVDRNDDVQVRVCRDAHALFVAFSWGGDGGGTPNLSDANVPPTRRGPAVGVCLKPELLHPGRSFIDFAIGADGSKVEGKGYMHRFGPGEKYFNGGFENKGWGFYADEWNRRWEGKVRRQGRTWTAELAIPVSSMDLNLDNAFWGVNFYARTAGGRTFAWSPAREVLREGWYIHQPQRSNGTRYFFGRLLGMKGMSAPRPYENMLRIVDAGLEWLPDDTIGAAVKVARNIAIPQKALPVEAEVRLIRRDADEPARTYDVRDLPESGEVKTTAATLSSPETVLRVGGFRGKWSEGGVYQLVATIRQKGGGTVLARRMRRVVVQDRYNSLLARVRLRTELTYYMAEEHARVLVESALATDTTAAFHAVCAGARREVKVVGDDRIPAGDKRYVTIDLRRLPLGDVRLVCELLGADGKPAARASDRLTRCRPVDYGVRINRVTGCWYVDGRWRILRERSRQWASHAEAAANSNLAWIRPAMSPHSMSQASIDRGVETIRAGREDPDIACWYLIDEPQGDMAACLELYDKARRADPHHAMNLGWGGPSIISGLGGSGTYRAIDVMSGAFYPFGLARSWSAPWNYTLQYGAMLYQVWGRDAAEHGIPLTSWMSVIRGGNPHGRPPSPDEMRCQHYLALIYGQRLIKYWTGQTPGTYYEPLFRRIVQDHREMDIFADFLNCRDVLPLSMGDRDNIHYALWGSDAGLFLLACNPTPWDLTASLPLVGPPGRDVRKLVTRAGRDGCATLARQSVLLNLRPYECAMLMLR